MMQLTSACRECNSLMNVKFHEVAVNGELRWSCSYRCSNCRAAIETDDTGFPPDEIRNLLIVESGRWDVVIPLANRNKQALVRILRSHLALDLRAIANCLAQNPSIAFSGTRVEAEWIAGLLKTAGQTKTIVCQADSNATS